MTRIGDLAIHNHEVTHNIYDILTEHKAELGIADVWYGAQELMPNLPCLVVEPRPKRRRFNGTRRWELTFQATITLFHGAVQETSVTEQEQEEQAALIEAFFHSTDAVMSLNGKVLLGYIVEVAPGTMTNRSVMYAATRLVWEGTSREQF